MSFADLIRNNCVKAAESQQKRKKGRIWSNKHAEEEGCWETVVSGKSTRDRMCVHPFLMDVSALCVGEYVFV